MFGLGFLELAVIAIAALVFVGPKKLPGLMKQFGKFFVQARRMSQDVRETFDTVVREAEDEIRQQEASAVRALLQSQGTENNKRNEKTIDVSPEPEHPTAAVPYEPDNYHHDDHDNPDRIIIPPGLEDKYTAKASDPQKSQAKPNTSETQEHKEAETSAETPRKDVGSS